jgi:hypothetical protein
MANRQSRGLRTDRSLLVILDGSKALRKAVHATFGKAAFVQRCQVHKMRPTSVRGLRPTRPNSGQNRRPGTANDLRGC